MSIDDYDAEMVRRMDPGVYVYRAIATKHALKLWINTGIRPNRHTKMRDLLAIATCYTGRPYKTSRKGKDDALADLTDWIEQVKEEMDS